MFCLSLSPAKKKKESCRRFSPLLSTKLNEYDLIYDFGSGQDYKNTPKSYIIRYKLHIAMHDPFVENRLGKVVDNFIVS